VKNTNRMIFMTLTLLRRSYHHARQLAHDRLAVSLTICPVAPPYFGRAWRFAERLYSVALAT
jgi:hypothetical protein